MSGGSPQERRAYQGSMTLGHLRVATLKAEAYLVPTGGGRRACKCAKGTGAQHAVVPAGRVMRRQAYLQSHATPISSFGFTASHALSLSMCHAMSPWRSTRAARGPTTPRLWSPTPWAYGSRAASCSRRLWMIGWMDLMIDFGV